MLTPSPCYPSLCLFQTNAARVLKGDDGDKDDGDGTPGTDEIVDAVTEAACFSEVSTVQVQNKGPVAMKDLQVGDYVLTANNEYQPVYAFGHWVKMCVLTLTLMVRATSMRLVWISRSRQTRS